MLYDLTFLDTKKPWPVPDEAPRMRRYARNEALYEAQHNAVFGNWWKLLRQDKKAALEIIVNFPRRLSNLWGDLILGEAPVYSRPDTAETRKREAVAGAVPVRALEAGEAAEGATAPGEAGQGGTTPENLETKPEPGADPLVDYIERIRFNSVTREVVTDMSRFGTGLYRVKRRQGRAMPEAVTPQIWYPVSQRGDIREVTAHVLAWTFTDTEKSDAGPPEEKTYLYAEIHRPGSIEKRLKYIVDGEIAASVGEARAQELFPDWKDGQQSTGFDGMLIFPVHNTRASNRLHGQDDYADIVGPLQEYEVRIAQTSRILDTHADPNIAGPKPTITTDARIGQTIQTGGRWFIVSDGEEFPQYMTWDGNLEAGFKEMEKLEEQIFWLSETSPTGFNMSRTGYAESGTALRLRMRSELSKAGRITEQLDPVAKDVIECATKLDRDMQPIRPAIEWKDGLPDDPKESAEIEAARKDAGLTSTIAAIMRLDGTDRQKAEDELVELLDDPERLEAMATVFKALGADMAPLKAVAARLVGVDKLEDAPPELTDDAVNRVGAMAQNVLRGQNGNGSGGQPPSGQNGGTP